MTYRNLVSLPREVTFDDTFNEVIAVLRFDTKIEDVIKVQLLIDLRHKKNPRLSKPKWYLTMSQPRQFENLITASLAMTCFHRLSNEENLTKETILATYDEIVNWIRADVENLTRIMFRDVQKVTRGTKGKELVA